MSKNFFMKPSIAAFILAAAVSIGSVALTEACVVDVNGLPPLLETAVGESKTISLADCDDAEAIWWRSSDENLVTVVPSVSDGGKSAAVHGWNAGRTTVTTGVQRRNGGTEYFECVVVVPEPENPREARGVKISAADISVAVDRSFKMEGDVVPSTATDRRVFWESSDPFTATVSSSGLVVGRRSGKATITAYTGDRRYSSSATVTVSGGHVPVSGVVMNHGTLDVHIDDTKVLVPIIYPADATNKRVRWSTSNRDVVAVSQNGVIIGMKKGTAVVSAVTEDGGYVAECLVSVVTSFFDFGGAGCSVGGGAFTPGMALLSAPLLLLVFAKGRGKR